MGTESSSLTRLMSVKVNVGLARFRYLGKPYDFSFSWSDDRQYCSEVVWKVYQNALGMRVGEQQKLKEFDLSNPLVQAKLKERYGKNIPLEETVVSPQAVFDANQRTRPVIKSQFHAIHNAQPHQRRADINATISRVNTPTRRWMQR